MLRWPTVIWNVLLLLLVNYFDVFVKWFGSFRTVILLFWYASQTGILSVLLQFVVQCLNQFIQRLTCEIVFEFGESLVYFLSIDLTSLLVVVRILIDSSYHHYTSRVKLLFAETKKPFLTHKKFGGMIGGCPCLDTRSLQLLLDFTKKLRIISHFSDPGARLYPESIARCFLILCLHF